MSRHHAACVLALLLAACAAPRPAPVVDRGPVQPAPPPVVSGAPAPEPLPEKPLPTHTVKRGETLVSIALQHGLDYRELAAWNGITNLQRLSVGQVLVLAAPPAMAGKPGGPLGTTPLAPGPGAPVATPLVSAGPPIEARPLANTPTVKVEPRGQKVPYSDKAIAQFSAPDSGPAVPGGPSELPPAAVPAPTPAAPPVPEAAKSGTQKEDIDWMWPAKGKVTAPFAEATKGMDIAGKRGSPVVAAAAGRVIYADAGLRGYGKLVIIRHNDTWLSAYAHNDNILVKEQQEVKKGQKIAEMGSTDTDQVKLHFEIRRQGKPVDPAKVLPPM
jgi:lipoprotein NlpD